MIRLCRYDLFKKIAFCCYHLLQAAPEPCTGLFHLRRRDMGVDIPEPGLNSGNETGLGVKGCPVSQNLR